MKKLIPSALSILTLSVFFAFNIKGNNNTIEVGESAPETSYKMKSISGEMISLEDVKEENGVLVVFSCNTCPFVLAWEDTYPDLAKAAKKANIGMVLVNSNEAKRDGEDSFNEMKEHAEEKGYGNLNYVVDTNSKLADAFGAKTTPHVFLFDKDMNLVFRGAINDKMENKDKSVKKDYLKDAMKNLANGKKIDPADTTPKGCSIKRVRS